MHYIFTKRKSELDNVLLNNEFMGIAKTRYKWFRTCMEEWEWKTMNKRVESKISVIVGKDDEWMFENVVDDMVINPNNHGHPLPVHIIDQGNDPLELPYNNTVWCFWDEDDEYVIRIQAI